MATAMQANVIDVSAPQFVKTAKGGYNFIEIAYKDNGKVSGKKVTDFGHDKAKPVFEFLKSVKAGDVLNVTLEKINDFWVWVSVEKEGNTVGTGMAELPAQGANAAQSTAPKVAGRVVGSNYETPDERAARQRLIVRQSSLTAALTLMVHNNPKTSFSVDMVTDMAEGLVNWVFEVKSGAAGLAAMKDDTV
jgi:hypothetical protein